jgi:hypothetical protein
MRRRTVTATDTQSESESESAARCISGLVAIKRLQQREHGILQPHEHGRTARGALFRGERRNLAFRTGHTLPGTSELKGRVTPAAAY